ncbi:MAG: Acetyltransferase (GNAT) family protein [Spirochaetes bacterium ADurb.Bin110]|nr:MAG: Acetyltransferase (GNAT) family protein [Spirochaetes bacterium ADurb.Bin110]
MIRKAEIDDSSRIADIQIFGWRNAYRGIINDEVLFKKLNIEKKSQMIRNVLEEGDEEWLVYEDNGIIKGMMIQGKSRDEDKKESFELWAIYVDPLMMRNGIGQKMIEYCEETARKRGYKENTVWVLEKNKIGRSFYEKNGYKEDGKKQNIEEYNAVEVRYCKEI